MHIVRNRSKQGKAKKIYQSTLLMESYREGKKVKKRTIANLSHCTEAEVNAIELALKYKGDLKQLASIKDSVIEQGQSMGSIWLSYQVAKAMGIEKSLGTGRNGKLALWQIIARLIGQGSRLSAVRLAKSHAACDILRIRKGFNEEDLYKNLGWLSDQQEAMETRLYQARNGEKNPQLYLYDVTSSYLEGSQNSYGRYGYNRDKKQGKQQIVIGLMCDEEGAPITVEVFEGNTIDCKTVANQVQKVAERFGTQDVIMVGDRGMLKRSQVEDLPKAFQFITAISKPEVEAMIRNGDIQMGLFENELSDISIGDYRYILRRNPVRTQEIRQTREEKNKRLQAFIEEQNQYLATHPKAQLETAKKKIDEKIRRFNMSKWTTLNQEGRLVTLTIDEDALASASKLDGCYVLKTDLDSKTTAETIHKRYKDLALVEQAFRSMKTVLLETRPIYVQSKKSTRGHVFIVMMAYLIAWKLRQYWNDMDCALSEGLDQLSTLCSIKLHVNHQSANCHHIPKPRAFVKKLLEKADVTLPPVLPVLNTIVDTRKKLVNQRIWPHILGVFFGFEMEDPLKGSQKN